MPDNAIIDSAAHQHEAAWPVTFTGNPGLFKPAKGQARNVAVLFLSPWGIDELSTRRFFRIVAEQLSEIGIASLRFDYPGTVNAMEHPDEDIDVETWCRAAIHGAAALRQLSGAQHAVLFGFGLGGAIALKVSRDIHNLTGLALLAPVVAGRRYLRELSLWSTMIDEGVGVPPHLRDTAPGTIAGLTMPRGIIDTLDTLNPKLLPDTSVSCIFLARRPDNNADQQLRDQLVTSGADVRDFEFSGYDRMVQNPHGQRFPDRLIPGFLDWMRDLPATNTPIETQLHNLSLPQALTSGTIRETAVRMGVNLIGTLCEPIANATDVTVVLLSTAYDHQAGWGRSSVELARRLAEKGIVSLRFDSAGVGDSPPVSDRRIEVLYDETQIADIAIARTFLETIGRTGPALLYGRCSGAYVAFRAAAEDQRWAGCIAINPYIFRWHGTPPENIARSAPRPLADYSRKAFRLQTVSRLLKGDIDVGAAVRHIRVRVGQRMSNLLAPILGPLMPSERLNRAVHSDVAMLSQRQGKTCIVYSAGDPGLDNMHVHFGEDGRKLANYANVELHILPDTDHNVTPRVSREMLYAIVERTALALTTERTRDQ